MARELKKSVTVAPALSFAGPVGIDDILAAAEEQGHVIYIDDSEEVPDSVEKVEELLAKDAEKNDIIIDKVVEADDADPDASPLNHVLATLDLLDADKGADAAKWKDERMTKPKPDGEVAAMEEPK